MCRAYWSQGIKKYRLDGHVPIIVTYIVAACNKNTSLTVRPVSN